MLKQPHYQPLPVEYQVLIIYAATKKYLLDIPVTDVLRFEKEFFEFVDTKYSEIPKKIRETKQMDEATESQLKHALDEFKKSFK